MSMIDNTLDVLWGTNGNIWIQRKLKTEGTEAKDLADLQEHLQAVRQRISHRVRNALRRRLHLCAMGDMKV